MNNQKYIIYNIPKINCELPKNIANKNSELDEIDEYLKLDEVVNNFHIDKLATTSVTDKYSYTNFFSLKLITG